MLHGKALIARATEARGHVSEPLLDPSELSHADMRHRSREISPERARRLAQTRRVASNPDDRVERRREQQDDRAREAEPDAAPQVELRRLRYLYGRPDERSAADATRREDQRGARPVEQMERRLRRVAS